MNILPSFSFHFQTVFLLFSSHPSFSISSLCNVYLSCGSYNKWVFLLSLSSFSYPLFLFFTISDVWFVQDNCLCLFWTICWWRWGGRCRWWFENDVENEEKRRRAQKLNLEKRGGEERMNSSKGTGVKREVIHMEHHHRHDANDHPSPSIPDYSSFCCKEATCCYLK